MKKLLMTAIVCAGVLFALTPSYAVQPAQVAGQIYRVTILCQDSIGNFCTANGVENDTFSFSDNGSFSIGSFQGGILNIGASGSYTETGMRFTANYDVIPQNTSELGTRYSFDIRGLSLLNILIVGQADISTESLGNLLGGATDTGRAFFIGFRQR